MSRSRTAQIRLVSRHPEVYELCDDSFALVDALLADRAKLIEHHPTICIEVTQETLKAHGVHAELMRTDIVSGLERRLAGLVDVLVVNLPYVPTPEDEVGRVGIASAWAGGENGRTVIHKKLPIADKLLLGKGWLYIVTLAENDPLQLCLQMREKGYAAKIMPQRWTVEESSHIIKFWRDIEGEEKHEQHSFCKDHGIF